MKPLAFIRAGLLLGLAHAWLAAGCSPDRSAEVSLGELSQECLVNSDCAEPLLCVFERCHVECVTTKDCDGTLRCVGAREPERVCQLEQDSTCRTSADCTSGLTCSQDGACRDVCVSDADCVGQQRCTKGVCAEPAELDDNGELPRILAQQDCRLDSDCDLGSICLRGVCAPQCRSDRDCEAGEICADGACQAPEPEVRCSCREDVDCAAGETCDGCACQPARAPECVLAADCEPGERCLNGVCSCGCVDDRDCPASRVCDGCICVPEPPVSVVDDAIIRSAADLDLMRGVLEVRGTLMLIAVTTTAGLETLESVGDLNVSYVNMEAVGPSPLAGLLGLTAIKGNLSFVDVNLTALELNPALSVEGDVSFSGGTSCQTIAALEASLIANGFDGCFASYCSGDCAGSCVAGKCVAATP
jgi:hypothetical protein